MKHILCRLSAALQEIQDGIRTFNGLQSGTTIPHYFMEETTALCNSTGALQGRFSLAVQNIGLSPLPFLLESTSHCLTLLHMK